MIACAILCRDSDGNLVGIAAGKTTVLLMEFTDFDDALRWVDSNLDTTLNWQIVELDEL